MQPHPSFNRTVLVLLVISLVPILGSGCLFATSDLGRATIIPATTPPSGSSSVEARTLTPLPSASPVQNNTSLPTEEHTPASSPESTSESLSFTSTLTVESVPTPSTTYTPVPIQSLSAGKHDDTDPNIAYDPYWTALKNPGTANAYKGTIHASTGIGDEASFHFIGKQFLLGYQRGKNFGTVTVIIDDQEYSFHEQAFDRVWRSPQLDSGGHFVRIIHHSGESINLDYIEILN